jgi:hypothetical protein
MMRVLFVLAGVAIGLFLIDRAALAMERRGWIYWRKRKANPGTRAAAALEIQQLLEPGTRWVEEAQTEHKENDDDGDDTKRRQGVDDATDKRPDRSTRGA